MPRKKMRRAGGNPTPADGEALRRTLDNMRELAASDWDGAQGLQALMDMEVHHATNRCLYYRHLQAGQSFAGFSLADMAELVDLQASLLDRARVHFQARMANRLDGS